MPPMHSQLMHRPSTCSNEWRPTVSTLCPLSLSHKKMLVVSLGYAQNEAQMNHPQGTF